MVWRLVYAGVGWQSRSELERKDEGMRDAQTMTETKVNKINHFDIIGMRASK